MKLFFDNLIDGGAVVLTPTSEDDEFPADNVLNSLRARPWKTLGTTATERLVFDLGSAQAVQALILLDHTLTAGDSSILIQGHTADSWGAPAFAASVTWVAGTILKVFDAAQTYRYWRLSFTKSAAAQIREIGRLFLGPLTALDVQPDYDGYTRAPEDLSTRQRTVGGQVFADVRASFRRVTLDFSGMPRTQFDDLVALTETVGTHTSFFVQIDEDDAGELAEAVYVKLNGLPKLKASGMGTDIEFDTKLELEEQL